MSIQVTCPSCQLSYRITREKLGKRARCKCGAVLVLPAAEAEAGGTAPIAASPAVVPGETPVTPEPRPSRGRGWKLPAACLLIGCVALAFVTTWDTARRVTKGDYDKLKSGMTLTEVEALLGPGKKVSPRDVPVELLGVEFEVYEWHAWQAGNDHIVVGLSGPAKPPRTTVLYFAHRDPVKDEVDSESTIEHYDVAAAPAVTREEIPLPGNAPVSRAKYDRVTLGMSEAEVTRILGAPTRSDDDDGQLVAPGLPRAQTKVLIWISADGKGIAVVMDKGKVTAKHSTEGPPQAVGVPPEVLTKLWPERAPRDRPPSADELTPVLAQLRSGKLDEQRRALKWLSWAKVNEARRDDVARALDPLLTAPALRDDVLNLLTKWATAANVPSLIRLHAALDKHQDGALLTSVLRALAATRHEDAAEVIGLQLRQGGGEAAALRLLEEMGPAEEKALIHRMHDTTGVAQAEVRARLQELGTQPELLVEQSVADLARPESQESALAWLMKQPQIAGKRLQVARALDPLLEKNLPVLRSKLPLGVIPPPPIRFNLILSCLEVWGGPENVPILRKVLDKTEDDERDRVLKLIERHKP